ncbi:MAG: hypothetical protein UY92_C0014G0100 [Candidatus Magasanikbacteria bacterium GW2011_GWA2_56_11]|uniref:DUF192 domain-containing protein n=1 Tax=Candidatus Magasanikbacteria bacterium GW2011_GWA2_56_11 TaxID=1619044 RepID=A0A0G1YF18_9BACT|nr:MAG: hypothetical protein UY92_C0014G0100 [Candidatus Magasanikbacteria bacterium GW2011_GWA2_56_11]
MKPLTPSGKKRVKITVGILFAAAAILQLWKWHWPEASVVLSGRELRVQVAKTFYHQHRGLGGREALAPYDGLLFPFGIPSRYAFVMRDMRFPIDIIWFRGGAVVDIAPNVQPENRPEEQLTRYYPRTEADLALEVPAGWAERHGVKLGDRISTLKAD